MLFYYKEDLGVPSRSKDTSKTPQLLVKIWYPIDFQYNKKFSPYFLFSKEQILNVLPYLMKHSFGGALPAWLVSHFIYLNSRSTEDAPIISHPSGKHPIIIFSHGLKGVVENYTYLSEELASFGYVVVAMNHSDGSCPISIFPNGKFQEFEPPSDELTDNELQQFRNNQVKKRYEDIDFVLNLLPNLNETTFEDLLDVNSVGIIGHSFGGSTALGYLLRSNSNIKIKPLCALGMDVWFYPIKKQDLDQKVPFGPFMFIDSELWVSGRYGEGRADIGNSICLRSSFDSFSLVLKGGSHHNYNDFVFYAPFLAKKLEMIGTHIDSLHSLQVIVNCCVSFFGTYLCTDPRQPLQLLRHLFDKELDFVQWKIK